MPSPTPPPGRWDRDKRQDQGRSTSLLSGDDATRLPTTTASFAVPSAASATSRPSSSNGFYSNQLFYILIAVLGAFALVSVLNFMRTRRRRRTIHREAQRLGLMVPGMAGYIPMRERGWFTKADGWRPPDWWEVEPDSEAAKDAAKDLEARGDAAQVDGATSPSSTDEVVADIGQAKDVAQSAPTPALTLAPSDPNGSAITRVLSTLPEDREVDGDNSLGPYDARGRLKLPEHDDLHPIALIPQPIVTKEPPKPWSPIPYFPNYVSYLASAHDPRPPRFVPDDPNTFDKLAGEEVQIVVALRMPTLERPKEQPGEDDDDAVIREWSGLELGVTTLMVYK